MKKHVRKSISLLLSLVLVFGLFMGLNASVAPRASAAINYIEFGTYPQQKITDASLIAALDEAPKKWTSYGYFSGSLEADWMRFSDFFYEGTKYRAVTFDAFRQKDVNGQPSLTSGQQSSNGYLLSTVYYFRYEPLRWRILDASTGLILCEYLIDSQAFQNEYHTRYDNYYAGNDGNDSTFANNYAVSSIRAWLSFDFSETAFTDAQKAKILSTELTHTAYSTEYPQFNSAPTEDKVFLLSYNDVTNSAYFAAGSSRQAQATEYARSQGHRSGFWMLRSPGSETYYSCCIASGSIAHINHIFSTDEGIRPACRLSDLAGDSAVSQTLFSHIKAGHTPGEPQEENRVDATCTANGSYDNVVRCTECGAVISSETVTLPAGHVIEIRNAKEPTATEDGYTGDEVCTRCGETIHAGTVIPKTGAAKKHGLFDWLLALLRKIIAFFTGLFK